MARGWESKSVESQQSETGPVSAKRHLTAEERERQARRESLESSRRRVQRELDAATSELRRTALVNALQHLDGELARLDGETEP